MSARKTKAESGQTYLKPNESRRGFIRVDFDPGSKVGVGMPSGETSFDALDVSVYGLSFLASPQDANRFSIGMDLPSIVFIIDGRQINVHGKVAHFRAGLIAGLSKIAIEFTEVSIEDVWFLSRYVADKAGVSKPRQIGSGMIDLDELAFPSRARKSSARTKKSKAKAKPKAKLKKKKAVKAKSKAKTKTKKKSAPRKSRRR